MPPASLNSRAGQGDADDDGDAASDDGRQDLVERQLADSHDQQADQDFDDGRADNADLGDANALRDNRW